MISMIKSRLGSFLVNHWQGAISLLLMASGIFLVWSGFQRETHVGDMRAWLKKNGDVDLLRYYDAAKDARERSAWCVACKAYEKRYGKGAWVQHFKEDKAKTPDGFSYREIAELAVGLSSVEERDTFLEAHAATYETCVRNGLGDLAAAYGRTLKELKEKGGESWRAAEHDPFALCVYEAARNKENGGLWNWYLENRSWCDPFLMAVDPELSDEDGTTGSGLAKSVEAVRDQAPLLKRFAEEIDNLSDEDLEALADGDNLSECREALFTSSLVFVGTYHNVLKPMLEVRSGISMLEAMAVVANNRTAFGLDEEDVLESPAKSREVALNFIRIHDERKTLWDFTMGERGINAIAFCEQVGNDEWCEQVIGLFGEAEVVPFLEKYYGESPRLLRVATEVLYRCQEPGWAVLQEYRENPQVKTLLLKDRVGYRLIPYYLKKGYAGFTELTGDERWIDELLDKNGNLKRMDVSWYEMSPIGGDVATVVKKWVQDRPVTAGELFWAGLDIADTAAMAFSFGMSKAAMTGARTATKVVVKQVGRRITRNIARKTMATIAKKTALRTARRAVGIAGKKTAKTVSRKVSFLRKISRWFKRTPSVTFKGKDALAVMKKPEALAKPWQAARKLDRQTWQKVYKGCKTLMWCRYFGHTIPDKAPDFIYGTLETSGEFVGKTLNALVAGAGDGLKAAVRETLGLPKEGVKLNRLINWILGGVVFLLGLIMLVKSGKGKAAVHGSMY